MCLCLCLCLYNNTVYPACCTKKPVYQRRPDRATRTCRDCLSNCNCNWNWNCNCNCTGSHEQERGSRTRKLQGDDNRGRQQSFPSLWPHRETTRHHSRDVLLIHTSQMLLRPSCIRSAPLGWTSRTRIAAMPLRAKVAISEMAAQRQVSLIIPKGCLALV